MKVFLYTFRTFPCKDQLQSIDNEIFIFGKLKEDLVRFVKIIQKEKPKYIIGVALSETDSKIESYAVNMFSELKKIQKDGPDRIDLYVPNTDLIKISPHHTTSFCNWTIYRIAHYVTHSNLTSKLMFVHINSNDITKLRKLIQSLDG